MTYLSAYMYPTDFQMYRQNSEKALLASPPLATLVLSLEVVPHPREIKNKQTNTEKDTLFRGGHGTRKGCQIHEKLKGYLKKK